MGRVIGILLLVLGVWLGMELYTAGLDGAFGGAFSSSADSQAAAAPPTERAREAVQNAMDQGEDRVNRALENAR